MPDERKNIDKLFHDVFKDYEEDVPLYVWDNIEEELDKGRKKKIYRTLWGIAASLTILIAFGAGYLLTRQHAGQNHIANQSLTERTDSNTVVPQTNNDVALFSEEMNEEMNEVINDENDDVTDAQTEQQTVDTEPENQQDVANNQTIQSRRTQNNDETKQSKQKTNESITIKKQTVADNKNKEWTHEKPDVDGQIRSTDSTGVLPLELKQIKSKPVTAMLQMRKPKHEKTTMPLDTLPFYPESFPVEKTFPESKWQFGGQFSQVYATSDLNFDFGLAADDMEYAAPNNQITIRNTNQASAVTTYSGGLCVEYQPKKRFSIQSGLVYLKKAQKVENIPVTQYKDYALNSFSSHTSNVDARFDSHANSYLESLKGTGTSSNFQQANWDIIFLPNESIDNDYNTPGDSISIEAVYRSDLQLNQNFHYLEIPLLFKYKVVDKRIDANLISGITTGVLVGNKAAIAYDNTELWSGSTEKVNRIRYDFSIGLGLEFALCKRLSLHFEPMFKYSLRPVDEDNVAYDYPLGFSCYTGLKIGLN